MQTQWFIRVARALFLLFCAGVGVMGAGSFDLNSWTGGLVGALFGGGVIGLDMMLGRVSVRHASHAVFGLLMGLISAYLITRLFILQMGWLQQLEPTEGYTVRNTIEIAVYAVLGFLGITLAVRSDRDQFALIIPYVRFRRDSSEGEPLLLDTNIVIDGRILRLIATGFLSGTLVIPRSVLDELQRLADSRDPIKSERGKRGLHVLEELRAIRDLDLTIHDDGQLSGDAVDTRLAALARDLNARLLTNDENLAQVARLRGVTVLSINDLSRAVQMDWSAGEVMEIALVKPGREKHQALGYLPDGAMIVVNQAADRIGQTVKVKLSGTTQTSAGRLIFAELVAAVG